MNKELIDFLKVYVTYNYVPPEVLPTLMISLKNLFNGQVEIPTNIQDTITDDYIVCLEDGRHMKILKRHLQQTYGMTPEEYRLKWKLPPDYPMVAKNYALQRSSIAKGQGLGKRAA